MSDNKKLKRINWLKKRLRIKSKLKIAIHPRLVVFRSNKNIYGQLIDDSDRVTIVSSSTIDKELKDKILKIEGKVEKSKLVGMSIGKKLKDKKTKKIIFDRNGYKYHGRVKALADGIRESGINF